MHPSLIPPRTRQLIRQTSRFGKAITAATAQNKANALFQTDQMSRRYEQGFDLASRANDGTDGITLVGE